MSARIVFSSPLNIYESKYAKQNSLCSTFKMNYSIVTMSDLFSQCTLANYENTVWFDVNGFKLVHYFPHLISESSSNDVLNAFHTLTTLYPPNSPGARELTSRHQYYLERKESLPPNTQSGVYRFTIYHQPGHKLDPPTFSKHFLQHIHLRQLVFVSQNLFINFPSLSQLFLQE